MRPNILFIMVDELAAHALPTYGHRVVKAPNLTLLAESSAVFDNAYTNSPICAPARTSLLTGLLVPQLGTWDNGAEFRSEFLTIPHYLRSLGYKTCLSGKMHFIGPDQLHGYASRLTTEIYPADFSWTTNWSAPSNAPNTTAGLSMRPILEAGPCVRNLQIDYDEDVHFSAKQFLFDHVRSSDKERPFFLTVSFTQPHPPFVAARECWDRYDGVEIDPPRIGAIPFEELDPQAQALYFNHRRDSMPVPVDKLLAARRAYYGMISWIDDRVGELIQVLKDTGLESNTIVVFTSDHGEMLGERGMWLKMCMFEWSVRVPLFLKVPGLPPGRHYENVSLVDLLPTLLALAQPSTPSDEWVTPVEQLAGSSLTALLYDRESHVWPDTVISDYMAGPMPSPVRMVKQGTHKLIQIRDSAPILFDLADDPDELRNVAQVPAKRAILQELALVASQGYDIDAIDAAVRLSQKRRLMIRSINDGGSEGPDWNWSVKAGDAFRYVRGWGLENGEHGTKARSRFPHP